MARRWSKDELEKLTVVYPEADAGLLVQEFNRPYPAIKQKAHRIGIEKMSWWTEAEDKFLRDNYNDLTNYDIGQKLKRTICSVDTRANRLGLYKSKDFFGVYGLKNRKYYLDESFFSQIDTQDKAYCLGFILGDGSIHKSQYHLSIKIHQRDIEVLHYFRIKLKTNIRMYNCLDCVEFKVSSKRLVSDLIDLGINPNKTRNIIIPKISTDLYPHFIRGLFDADGCIYLNKSRRNYPRVSVTGDIITCLWFKSFIEDQLGTNVGVHRKNNGVCTSYIDGRERCSQIAQWFYKGANFFLARKYNKFVEAGLL